MSPWTPSSFSFWWLNRSRVSCQKSLTEFCLFSIRCFRCCLICCHFLVWCPFQGEGRSFQQRLCLDTRCHSFISPAQLLPPVKWSSVKKPREGMRFCITKKRVKWDEKRKEERVSQRLLWEKSVIRCVKKLHIPPEPDPYLSFVSQDPKGRNYFRIIG